MRATLCVECGPSVAIDEDGCCVTCGNGAVGRWVSENNPAAHLTATSAVIRQMAEALERCIQSIEYNLDKNLDAERAALSAAATLLGEGT